MSASRFHTDLSEWARERARSEWWYRTKEAKDLET